MPDRNDALPPVGANQSNSSAASTLPPVTKSNQEGINNSLPEQEKVMLSGNKAKLAGLGVKKVAAFVILIIVILISYFVYFVHIPNSQSRDYILQASGDFENLKSVLAVAGGDDSKLGDKSTSFEIAKGVYFDIAHSADYVEAAVDAKRDLEVVKTVQGAITDARKNKEKFRAGGSVKKLDLSWESYLEKQEAAVNRLQTYENLRVELTLTQGDEYERELSKLLGIYDADTPAEEKLRYLENLSRLSAESLDRLKGLQNVPEDFRSFYETTLSGQEDLSTTLNGMVEDFKGEGKDAAAISRLSAFGERQLERIVKSRDFTTGYVSSSETSSLFKEAIDLEAQTQEELNQLKAKYGI